MSEYTRSCTIWMCSCPDPLYLAENETDISELFRSEDLNPEHVDCETRTMRTSETPKTHQSADFHCYTGSLTSIVEIPLLRQHNLLRAAIALRFRGNAGLHHCCSIFVKQDGSINDFFTQPIPSWDRWL